MNTYKIKPLYKSFVWGGDKLIKKYNLDSSLKNIGTIYCVIAIENDLDNIVEETGETLSNFYKNNPEIFGCTESIFPVRMTITCNDSYQSYQIHPNDEYALEHEGTKGKVSGSIALFPEEGSVRKMLFGNKCKTLEEFKDLVDKEDWDNLFEVVERPSGAWLHTPAGLIHGGKGNGAISATWGTNGDITYRFFDYHRDDPNRPLHMQQCYDTVNIPEVEYEKPKVIEPDVDGDLEIFNYYEKSYEYVAKRIKCHGKGIYEYSNFMFYTCVNGSGKVAGRELGIGETLLVPQNYGPVEIEGEIDLIMLSYHQ